MKSDVQFSAVVVTDVGQKREAVAEWEICIHVMDHCAWVFSVHFLAYCIRDGSKLGAHIVSVEQGGPNGEWLDVVRLHERKGDSFILFGDGWHDEEDRNQI